MENKAPKQGKWYMTLIGGLIGLILGFIPSAASILIFNELYFVCLMFTPILACLFIKFLGGNKNIYALLYAIVLSLIGTAIAGFMLEANVLIQIYTLPKQEIIRLTALMIAEIGTYGADVWSTLTADVFNIIILIGYLVIGILFSWEFILRPKAKKAEEAEASDTSKNEEEKEEFEYVYEDELESDDEVVETEE